MQNHNFWIGRFGNSGRLVLFDPELNDPETAEVNLFLPDEMALQTYEAKEVRPRLQKVEEKSFQLVAESSYWRWQQQQQREHKQNQEQLDASQYPSQSRRKMKYWQRKGRKKRRPYVAGTECYCGEALNPLQNKSCERCGWLICNQRHCGCTYKWDRG